MQQFLQQATARKIDRLSRFITESFRPRDDNGELIWPIFGREARELCLALLKERCEQAGPGTAANVLAR